MITLLISLQAACIATFHEFLVEVRPNFELPSYDQIKIKRPNREVSEADIDEAQQRFLEQYAEHVPTDDAAEPGEFVRLAATFRYKESELRSIEWTCIQHALLNCRFLLIN